MHLTGNRNRVLALCVMLAGSLMLTSTSALSWGQNKTPKYSATINQFDSEVPEITPSSATDMFTTALVKTGAFNVLERKRLDSSVYQEKQLNQSGMTSGDAAQHRLTGADFIFVGVVTEANAQASSGGLAATIKGIGIESSEEVAEVAIDVRVLDARTGAVLDAVSARKKVKQSGMSLSGLGKLLGGKAKGLNLSTSSQKKDGIDKALRAVIDMAVKDIVSRFEE